MFASNWLFLKETKFSLSALRADWENEISSKNNQFVADNIAAGLGLEPRLMEPESIVLPIRRPRNVYFLFSIFLIIFSFSILLSFIFLS